MKLLHTVLELDRWIYSKLPCSFCVSLKEEDKIVCQIRTRSEVSHRIIENSVACQNCKEKFERGELPKCEKCDRLKTDSNVDIFSEKYVCDCEKEDEQEKELPILPGEERESTFYERQINDLREKLTTAEEAIEIEREEVAKFQEKSEEWSKNQKQELLDEIKKLKEEVEQLKEQNQKVVPEELVKEITELRKQLEQANNQLAQIEVKETKRWPWKLRK